MKRIILLVWVAMAMSALVLASALPALAAPPTFSASCIYPDRGLAILTGDPHDYNEVNAFYRSCKEGGGTASRDITPNPGPPTR